MFQSPPPYPRVRKESPPKSHAGGQTHDAQHGPDDSNRGFLSHICTAWEKRTPPAGYTGEALGSRVNRQRLWEPDSVVTGG